MTDPGADAAKDGRPEGRKGIDESDSEDDQFEDALEKLNISDGSNQQHTVSSATPVSICA